ncbi:class I SAM-dependent methyltransferase [Natronobacterium texcoconense]|uniref:Methyltransferase domain-containing protein n=1 Tax=Natronobacterium texcoconense TaxID=1095778 RepID=A0A1H0ZF64_NATTX|nr:class I SAM-dependent methyltransferase [Natronobacterium texcoconense]SDQ26063.1 Methyltransferase domain-containing protein [Natronobacterium texcoconense]
MNVPSTVERALADRTVDDRVCLEAGAGVGNTTAGLLEAGAREVHAVTNDPDHASEVRERIDDERAAIHLADLRSIPLSDDSVEVVTAHALCNVVSPSALAPIAEELTRVTAPGGTLVVDDYAPIPDSSPIRDLFAVENAAAELVDAEPALTFYPASGLRRLFAGHGWEHDRTRTILEPVPWTADLLEAHVDVVRDYAADLPDDLAEPLVERADRLVAEIGTEEVGEMYSLAMQYPKS